MTGNSGPFALFYLMIVVAVASSLVAVKLPGGRAVKMAAAWIAIFAGFFVIFAFRGEFLEIGQRLKAEAIGSSVANGAELRVPMADDGHFWVEAKVNGRPSRFLVDSGASVTTISRGMPRQAGVSDAGQHIVIETANGPASA